MAFMVPEYANEDFAVVDGDGEVIAMPAEYVDDHVLQLDDDDPDIEFHRNKWWARLSAPGYMDATGWTGPFDTESEARQYIVDTYDIDPDTGDALGEEAPYRATAKKKKVARRSMRRRTQPKTTRLAANPQRGPDPDDPNNDPEVYEYELPRMTLKEAREIAEEMNKRFKAAGSKVRLRIVADRIVADRTKKRRGFVQSHKIIMDAPWGSHDIGVGVSSKRRLFAHLHGFCRPDWRPARGARGSTNRGDTCKEVIDEVYDWQKQIFKQRIGGPRTGRSMRRRRQPPKRKDPKSVIAKFLRKI